MNKKILLVTFMLLLTGCGTKYDHYEYTDMAGNKGVAKDCWVGAYGNSFKCELEDGTLTMVQTFKGVTK